MPFLSVNNPQFRIGFVLTPVSLEVHFGWWGFLWLWKQVLETLPESELDACLNCGAMDWTSCNTTKDGKSIEDCNKCGSYPGGPQ